MRGLGDTALGPLVPGTPPTMDALQAYNVNRAGQPEVIWQPQYHYQSYAMAGATQFTFFQTPLGQSGTTKADTSMVAAGQFPRPQEFLVTGIQVYFKPAAAVALAGQAPATAQTNWLDTAKVLLGSAWLELFIGSKAYLDDGPLAKFTTAWGLTGSGWRASASTLVASGDAWIDYARSGGRYYSITPVKLPANQNFAVTINYPTAVSISAAATIGVILDGFLYRLSQ
jgi:hypothetical protein